MAGLTISFRGLDADSHHLEAFAGIESAAGIARALTIIGHYAATGEVRHRYPFTSDLRFYLEGTEEGSFNWKIGVTIGSIAMGLATNGIYDLAKLTIGKAIGEDPAVSAQVENINKTKSGDIDALVEAIEPALKKAHYGVGETATQIIIQETSSKKVIVKLDEESKIFLRSSVDGRQSIQDVAISALNVNNRTGRAYFLDLRRTIPFFVHSDAEAGTMSILSAAIDRYANSDPAPVRITFKRIEAVDGRLKKIIVLKAEDVSGTE